MKGSLFAFFAVTLACASLSLSSGAARADDDLPPAAPPPGATDAPLAVAGETGASGAPNNPLQSHVNLNLPANYAETHPAPAADAPVQWHWSRVGTTEYVITAAAGATAIASNLFMTPGTPHLTGTNPADDGVRNALRLSSESGRNAVDTASSVLVGALAAFPIIVDAAGVAWIKHGDGATALQMASVDALSFAVVLGADGVVKNVVARPRPCTRDAANPCTGADADRSFFSGHTVAAFTAAGLICVQHQHLHLYGNKFIDGLVCGLAQATAATVGAMRIMADKHYFTDVVTGAVIGEAAGYLLPSLLHFGFGREEHSGAVSDQTQPPHYAVNMSVSPMVGGGSTGTAAGAMLTGTF